MSPLEGRLLLPGQLLSRFLLVSLLLGVAISLPLNIYAQTAARGQCTFIGHKRSDLAGEQSAKPDGKPDVVFSLSLMPAPNDPPITEIQLQAANPRGSWTTTSRTPGARFIAVADARSPSVVLNRTARPLKIDPNQIKHLLLYLTDDGGFSRGDRNFTIRVVTEGGGSWMAPVEVAAGTPPESAETKPGVYPVRMSAYLKGISNFDAVNPGKQIAGDDKADGLFQLSVEARDKVITGIEVRNVDGMKSVWDTVPGSPNSAIGVAAGSDPVKLLNNRDGSVRIPVQDRVDLNLYVADNGSIAGGKTQYRVAVTFSDGEISWSPVQAAPPASPEIKLDTTQPPPRPKVNFLGTWMGYVTTDAVGPYSGMKPDGKPDAVFGLDIEVSPKNDIVGLEIQSLDGISKRWGTGGTTPGNWGMGVAYQTTPKALINRPDGSVSIPISNRAQFYLYVADPGDLAATNQQLRMIVHFADGSSFQQYIRRPTASTATVVPGTGETPKARGIITCEFRGFIADLVNTSTRPRKDGYLDGTFILKLQVDDKRLAKVEIKTHDGIVRWSSDPKPPVMFLGVAVYPKIFKLINPTGGNMNVQIPNKQTLNLYAADNGLLSDPNSRLIATVTFTDKTTLSAEVIR
ncbi:MAG: hypothetical protein RDU20_20465 [Desulfomonilaceae bacterium]|nr:hypothetical protein [Desulfomonilaceae bacterium]